LYESDSHLKATAANGSGMTGHNMHQTPKGPFFLSNYTRHRRRTTQKRGHTRSLQQHYLKILLNSLNISLGYL